MSCEDHRQKAFAALGQGNAAPLEAIYQAAATLPAQASPKVIAGFFERFGERPAYSPA